MSKPLVTVENISYRYDKRSDQEVLHDVSFCINKGEWLSIIGDNGSGKSTIAKLLVGLLHATKGQISFDQLIMNDNTKWEIRQQLGIVFQNPDNQFIGTTVEDDVAFSLENMNLPYVEMQKRVTNALKLVGILELRKLDPSMLSGGQKQKVALAGVLALKPKLIILDEAFVMLDPKSRNSIIDILEKLKKRSNLTIVSITHDISELASADRVIKLKAGNICFAGATKDYFSHELAVDVPVAEQLRRSLIAKGKQLPTEYMTEAELVKWIGNSL